jgi:hypothetical protein
MTEQNAQPSKKAMRHKLGTSGVKVTGDQLLIRELDGKFAGPAHACLAIDRKKGQFVYFNVYGEKGDVKIGRNFEIGDNICALPPEGDQKWKKWSKKGYAEIGEHDNDQYGFTELADVDVFELVPLEAEKPASTPAKTAKAKDKPETPATA